MTEVTEEKTAEQILADNDKQQDAVISHVSEQLRGLNDLLRHAGQLGISIEVKGTNNRISPTVASFVQQQVASVELSLTKYAPKSA